MKIWLVQIWEPHPTDGPVRLYRTGMLAQKLVEQGHEVVWWSGTFDHVHKHQRHPHDHTYIIGSNFRIEQLHASGYKTNLDLNRLRYYRQMVRKFERRIQNESPPDIIFTNFPVPEMSYAAVKYANQHQIPIVIDVRDLWPDSFVGVVPDWAQPLAHLALKTGFNKNHRIFRDATGIIGISTDYLEWGLSYAGRAQRQTDQVFPLGYQSTELSAEELTTELEELKQCGVDFDKFIACFFGSFANTYDLEIVVRAARRLEESGNQSIQFVLCGEGEKLEKIRQMAAGLTNVIFPGWIHKKAISALMAKSSVGLAPYVANAPQSLPNKPFEYFSGGLPIISSLSGELETLLEQHDCGITYDPESEDALIDALQTLICDPKRRKQMGENGRKLFKTAFSADLIYPQIIDHLSSIARTQPEPKPQVTRPSLEAIPRHINSLATEKNNSIH